MKFFALIFSDLGIFYKKTFSEVLHIKKVY
jgi:hypothetical protein